MAGADRYPLEQGRALGALGALTCQSGNPQEGVRHLEEAVRLLEEAGNPLVLGDALFFWGTFQPAAGETDRAEATLQRALAIFKKEGEHWGLSSSLSALGLAAMYARDYERAQGYIEESLHAYRSARDMWGKVHALNMLGDVARCVGDYARARALYEESLKLAEDIGLTGTIPSLQHNLAWIAHDIGDDDQAIQLFRVALAAYRDLADARGEAECVMGMAAALASRRPEDAARLFAAATTAMERMNIQASPPNRIDVERDVHRLQTALPGAGWERLRDNGRALTLPEVVSRLLHAEA
jgi:tetratricopeptide (TPR) repeat protein